MTIVDYLLGTTALGLIALFIAGLYASWISEKALGRLDKENQFQKKQLKEIIEAVARLDNCLCNMSFKTAHPEYNAIEEGAGAEVQHANSLDKNWQP